MKVRLTVFGILALPFLLFCLCLPKRPDYSEQGRRINQLKDAGDMVLLYGEEHRKPPTKLADLLPYKTEHLEGYRAIESGQVVVRWGVQGRNGDQKSDRVIVYERDTPTQGGYVWLANE